jgi:Flp pilus assembly protein TadG
MLSSKRKWRAVAHRFSSQRGVAAVQFAIVSGLVLVIVFGILEFGLIFLQEHYVADAAREGARVGVRAQNYDCFTMETGCLSSRQDRTTTAVEGYLNIFYDPDELTVTVTSNDLDPSNDGGENLTVFVQAPNFVPGLFTSLLKLVSGSDLSRLQFISFTASMAYEDPDEYAEENN